MTPLIRKLRDTLNNLLKQSWSEYAIPGLWVAADSEVKFASAPQYFLHQLSIIENLAARDRKAPYNLAKACIYNGMVRHMTSYNHGPAAISEGWNEHGTFLKFIALLPYLRKLGVDTVLLLPITEIGSVGRKGNAGSPYAVSHPLHIDINLSEPLLNWSVEDQARVFVECCHAVGIKVVLETVLRTSAVNSSLAKNNPEWFYWVDEEYVLDGRSMTAPSFSESEISAIQEMVDKGLYQGLPEPSEEYINKYSPPPLRVEWDEKGWLGFGPQNRKLRIPGAFADWPVNDTQPAWTDVTYLRLHDHPRYRYMAYNTVRMYERELDVAEYRQEGLWNTLVNIIPYWVRQLDIDGAMIDMGHALPSDLRKRMVHSATQAKPGFLLFEENFFINAQSERNGYHAVIGYLPLQARKPAELNRFLNKVAQHDIPIRYLATPESHNTPRIAQCERSFMGCALWLFLSCLPYGVRFIHAGMELSETVPVNTGLGFSASELQRYSQMDLPLFSNARLPWSGSEIAQRFIEESTQIRSLDIWNLLTDQDSVIVLTQSTEVPCYVRFNAKAKRGLLCLLNVSGQQQMISVSLKQLGVSVFLSVQSAVRLDGAMLLGEIAAEECLVLPIWVGNTMKAGD